MSNNYSIQELISLFRPNEPAPIFLIGAGASYEAGIPLASECVEKIAQAACAHSKGDDWRSTIVPREEWLPFLQNQTWFVGDENNIGGNFPAVVEYLLRPPAFRQAVFDEIVHNHGNYKEDGLDAYNNLAKLIKAGLCETVLTTNFDYLICEALNRVGVSHREVAEWNRKPKDFKHPTARTACRVVYLHGTIDYYSDKNSDSEIQQLDEELVNRLRPLLTDRPLIVVGYRGAENSVMQHLLIEGIAECNSYNHGIYWCSRGSALPQKVKDLAQKIGNNFFSVQIAGFGQLMAELNRALVPNLPNPPRRPSAPKPSPVTAPNPFKGMIGYDVKDESVFFGRTAQIKEVLDDLAGMWKEEKPVVYGIGGVTGAGKSSLLRAGICAILKSRRSEGEISTLLLGSEDLLALLSNKQILESTETPLNFIYNRALTEITTHKQLQLTTSSLWVDNTDEVSTAAVASLVTALALQGESQRLIVAIDQFEDLLDYYIQQRDCIELHQLFIFISKAVRTKRIGFIYTINSKYASILMDTIFNQIVVEPFSMEIYFPTTELSDIVQNCFKFSPTKPPREYIHSLTKEFRKLVDVSERNYDGALLPLFSHVLKKVAQFNSSFLPQNDDSDQRYIWPEPTTVIRDEIVNQCDEALNRCPSGDEGPASVPPLDNLLRKLVHIEANGNVLLREISTPAKAGEAELCEELLKRRLLVRTKRGYCRLVHAHILDWWKIAREWVEREQKSIATVADMQPLVRRWKENAKALKFAVLSSVEVKDGARLLRHWYEVFHPEDGTEPTEDLQDLREFLFAAIEKHNRPGEEAEGPITTASHFLMAVSYGRRDLLSRWLTKPQNQLRVKNDVASNGNSACTMACFARDAEILRLLLRHHPDVNLANEDGWTPFLGAARFGLTSYLEMLYSEGAQAQVTVNNGLTACILASVGGHLSTLQFCIERAACSPWNTDEEGMNALHYAAWNGEEDMVRYLLSIVGAEDVDQAFKKSNYNRSILHYAVISNSLATVKTVLSCPHVEPIEEDLFSQNAFDLAIELPDNEVLGLLLQSSLDDLIEHESLINRLLDCPDAMLNTEKGNLIVHFVITKPQGLAVIMAKLSKSIASGMEDEVLALIGEPLIREEIKIRQKEFLRQAVESSSIDILKLLIEISLPNRAKLPTLVTPLLFEAARRGKTKAIAILCNYGADVTQVNKDGNSAIQEAILSGQVSSAMSLLKIAYESNWHREITKLHFPDENIKAQLTLGKLLSADNRPEEALDIFRVIRQMLEENDVRLLQNSFTAYLLVETIVAEAEAYFIQTRYDEARVIALKALTMAEERAALWCRDLLSLRELYIANSLKLRVAQQSAQEVELLPLQENLDRLVGEIKRIYPNRYEEATSNIGFISST